MYDFSLNPPDLAAAYGYSHVTVKGEHVYVAGQTGQDASGAIVPGGLVAQMRQALANVRIALGAVGGQPADLASLMIFVADVSEYRDAFEELAQVWVDELGHHYPAATLVGRAELWQEEARVEVAAVAVVPGERLMPR